MTVMKVRDLDFVVFAPGIPPDGRHRTVCNLFGDTRFGTPLRKDLHSFLVFGQQLEPA